MIFQKIFTIARDVFLKCSLLKICLSHRLQRPTITNRTFNFRSVAHSWPKKKILEFFKKCWIILKTFFSGVQMKGFPRSHRAASILFWLTRSYLGVFPTSPGSWHTRKGLIQDQNFRFFKKFQKFLEYFFGSERADSGVFWRVRSVLIHFRASKESQLTVRMENFFENIDFFEILFFG